MKWTKDDLFLFTASKDGYIYQWQLGEKKPNDMLINKVPFGSVDLLIENDSLCRMIIRHIGKHFQVLTKIKVQKKDEKHQM